MCIYVVTLLENCWNKDDVSYKVVTTIVDVIIHITYFCHISSRISNKYDIVKQNSKIILEKKESKNKWINLQYSYVIFRPCCTPNPLDPNEGNDIISYS